MDTRIWQFHLPDNKIPTKYQLISFFGLKVREGGERIYQLYGCESLKGAFIEPISNESIAFMYNLKFLEPHENNMIWIESVPPKKGFVGEWQAFVLNVIAKVTNRSEVNLKVVSEKDQRELWKSNHTSSGPSKQFRGLSVSKAFSNPDLLGS